MGIFPLLMSLPISCQSQRFNEHKTLELEYTALGGLARIVEDVLQICFRKASTLKSATRAFVIDLLEFWRSSPTLELPSVGKMSNFTRLERIQVVRARWQHSSWQMAVQRLHNAVKLAVATTCYNMLQPQSKGHKANVSPSFVLLT
eukprot:s898_g3.t1